MSELVSIIMPSYQSARFIEKAMSSALSQSYQDIELIVIDNPSTDGTSEIVSRIAASDSRVFHHLLPEKLGSAAITRNYGIQAAKGRYLAFLDSDDLWFPEKIEKQIKLLAACDGGFSFTGYRVIDENDAVLHPHEAVPEIVSYRQLLRQTSIATSTVLLDRKMVKSLLFPENMVMSEDFPTWLGALKQCHVAYGLPEALAEYRIVAKSLSSRKLKSAQLVWNVYRQREGLGLLDAAWCFAQYSTYALMKNRRFKRL